ncbi:aldehyde dehydrogenase family protein [Streptomyces krungchingensis]
MADEADAARAADAAHRPFEQGPWPRMNPRERGQVLMRAAELLREWVEEFAELEAFNVGKPPAAALATCIASRTGRRARRDRPVPSSARPAQQKDRPRVGRQHNHAHAGRTIAPNTNARTVRRRADVVRLLEESVTAPPRRPGAACSPFIPLKPRTNKGIE